MFPLYWICRGYYYLRLGSLYLLFVYYDKWYHPFSTHAILIDGKRCGHSIVVCLGLFGGGIGLANHLTSSTWAHRHHIEQGKIS